MEAVDADKEDVISECVRQLSDIKTYLNLTEGVIKNIITEMQNKLKRMVGKPFIQRELHEIRGKLFVIKNIFFDIPHFYIIWKIL